MTRAEHLAWAKQRALACVDRGDLRDATASMIEDLRKHPETSSAAAELLSGMLMLGGHLETPAQVRHWIEGFN